MAAFIIVTSGVTIALLRECVSEASKGRARDEHTRQKLEELYGFFETTSDWYMQLRQMPTGAVIKLARLGGRVQKLLGVAS